MLGQSYRELYRLQLDIGSRIVDFLLQKCRIGMEIVSHKGSLKNWKMLKQEIYELFSILSKEVQEEKLMDLNWELKSFLPLSSIPVPQCLP